MSARTRKTVPVSEHTEVLDQLRATQDALEAVATGEPYDARESWEITHDFGYGTSVCTLTLYRSCVNGGICVWMEQLPANGRIRYDVRGFRLDAAHEQFAKDPTWQSQRPFTVAFVRAIERLTVARDRIRSAF
jgi:hypothetical protein